MRAESVAVTLAEVTVAQGRGQAEGEQDRAEKAATVSYFHATRYPTAHIRTVTAPSDQRLRAKVPAPSLVP